MNKGLKKLVVLVVAVVGVFLIAGCGSKKDPIVGKWAYSGDSFIFTFNEDKTGSYDISGEIKKFTYEIKDGKLSILYDGDTDPFVTDYKIENNVLTIKDSLDNDVKYTKK